jgi:hypothetical protein
VLGGGFLVTSVCRQIACAKADRLPGQFADQLTRLAICQPKSKKHATKAWSQTDLGVCDSEWGQRIPKTPWIFGGCRLCFTEKNKEKSKRKTRKERFHGALRQPQNSRGLWLGMPF